MAISDTTNSSRASQHSKDHDALREKINIAEKINITLKDFDVLPSKRKITRLIFNYGWLLPLISYFLYFVAAAYTIAREIARFSGLKLHPGTGHLLRLLSYHLN